MNRTALLSTLAVVALAGLGTGATFLLPQERDWSQPLAARGHQPLRVLQVAKGDSAISQGGQVVPVERVRGAWPTAGSPAVVTSDENCQPDTSGVSHCINRLKLADGQRLVVRHNHRMQQVPCLAPGERVALSGV